MGEKVVSTRRLPATLINIDVCNFFWKNRNAPISMLLFLVRWWTMFFDDFTKPLRWDLYCQHCRRIILSIYISITAPTRKRKYTAPTRKRKYTAPTRKRKYTAPTRKRKRPKTTPARKQKDLRKTPVKHRII